MKTYFCSSNPTARVIYYKKGFLCFFFFYHFTKAEEQTFVFKSHINKHIKTYFLKLSYFNVIILNVTVLI